MIIGHNRKATHGERKDVDAHPFYTEPICLVHNGMISNHKNFCKEATVDSNAICNAFAKGNYKEVLSEIEGAYAFIWYNIEEKKLYFIRNDRRPLFIIETTNTYILASEKEMVEWICKRNTQTIKSIKDIDVDTLYTFDLESRELEEEKLEIKPISKRFQQPANNLTYLPNPRRHHTTTNHNSIIKPTLLDDGKVLNLTDEDFFLINKIPEVTPDFLIGRGDRITFEVEDIEDHTKPTFVGNLVKISGGILNCPRVPVTVVGYIPISDMDSITVNFVATSIVNRIEKKEDQWVIHTYHVDGVHPVIKSANNYWITNDMWMSENFDNFCNKCNAKVSFEDLDKWDVFPNNDDETQVRCPICKHQENLCSNESC
jgi:hypothetical protein